jgi:hypothetical protein
VPEPPLPLLGRLAAANSDRGSAATATGRMDDVDGLDKAWSHDMFSSGFAFASARP